MQFPPLAATTAEKMCAFSTWLRDSIFACAFTQFYNPIIRKESPHRARLPSLLVMALTHRLTHARGRRDTKEWSSTTANHAPLIDVITRLMSLTHSRQPGKHNYSRARATWFYFLLCFLSFYPIHTLKLLFFTFKANQPLPRSRGAHALDFPPLKSN